MLSIPGYRGHSDPHRTMKIRQMRVDMPPSIAGSAGALHDWAGNFRVYEYQFSPQKTGS